MSETDVAAGPAEQTTMVPRDAAVAPAVSRGAVSQPVAADEAKANSAMAQGAVEPRRPKKSAPEAANFRLLQAACDSYLDEEGREKVDRAYRFAAEYHRDQRRRSGEPYINHPVEVALILAHDLRMDEDTICAALLHDTVEDTPATKDQVAEMFGPTVADLVDGVTKLTSIQVSSMDAKQAWNSRSPRWTPSRRGTSARCSSP